MEGFNLGNPAALNALAKGDFRNALVASTPGGIERQEAEGQKDLVKKQMIPKDFNGCKKEDFEKMGIKFIKESDSLFYECELPKGWKIKPTDHSMWSNLIDDKGKVRASIFYKAAFYDMKAHVQLES